MEQATINPSTRIPTRFRFCTDECPECKAARNLPQGIAGQSRDGITFDYLCDSCGHRWACHWDKTMALTHSTNKMNELVALGRKAVNTRRPAAEAR